MSGLSHELLEGEGPQQWPYPSGSTPTTEAKRLYEDHQFATPNKRARFSTDQPLGLAEPPCDTYPLVLTVGRYLGQWHTMTRTGKVERLLKQHPEPLLEIHPGDAQELKRRNGELAAISSRRGHLTATVKVTDRIRRGSVFLPMHWGFTQEKACEANTLMHDEACPVSKQPELKACAVIVAPAVSVVKPLNRSADDWRPCAGCSLQHFAEGCLQVVVVVPRPHQLAEGEAIQLTELGPLLQGQRHTPHGGRLLHHGGQLRLLPWGTGHRWQILGHAIGHGSRAIDADDRAGLLEASAVSGQSTRAGRCSWESAKPVVELQLHPTQIQVCVAHTEGIQRQLPMKSCSNANNGWRNYDGWTSTKALIGVNDDNGSGRKQRCSSCYRSRPLRFAISLGMLLGMSHGWVTAEALQQQVHAGL